MLLYLCDLYLYTIYIYYNDYRTRARVTSVFRSISFSALHISEYTETRKDHLKDSLDVSNDLF